MFSNPAVKTAVQNFGPCKHVHHHYNFFRRLNHQYHEDAKFYEFFTFINAVEHHEKVCVPHLGKNISPSELPILNSFRERLNVLGFTVAKPAEVWLENENKNYMRWMMKDTEEKMKIFASEQNVKLQKCVENQCADVQHKLHEFWNKMQDGGENVKEKGGLQGWLEETMTKYANTHMAKLEEKLLLMQNRQEELFADLKQKMDDDEKRIDEQLTVDVKQTKDFYVEQRKTLEEKLLLMQNRQEDLFVDLKQKMDDDEKRIDEQLLLDEKETRDFFIEQRKKTTKKVEELFVDLKQKMDDDEKRINEQMAVDDTHNTAFHIEQRKKVEKAINGVQDEVISYNKTMNTLNRLRAEKAEETLRLQREEMQHNHSTLEEILQNQTEGIKRVEKTLMEQMAKLQMQVRRMKCLGKKKKIGKISGKKRREESTSSMV
jgi:hypothetical protein